MIARKGARKNRGISGPSLGDHKFTDFPLSWADPRHLKHINDTGHLPSDFNHTEAARDSCQVMLLIMGISDRVTTKKLFRYVFVEKAAISSLFRVARKADHKLDRTALSSHPCESAREGINSYS